MWLAPSVTKGVQSQAGAGEAGAAYAVVTTPRAQVAADAASELRCAHLWTWRSDRWEEATALSAVGLHKEMGRGDERR